LVLSDQRDETFCPQALHHGQEMTWMEREANAGAAKLLMPRQGLVDSMAYLGANFRRMPLRNLVIVMAETFSVSREAMAYRLSDPDVKMIPWEEANRLIEEERPAMREVQHRITKRRE
jgi:Zn-dependent peptidase ImmA (M78 family)